MNTDESFSLVAGQKQDKESATVPTETLAKSANSRKTVHVKEHKPTTKRTAATPSKAIPKKSTVAARDTNGRIAPLRRRNDGVHEKERLFFPERERDQNQPVQTADTNSV